MSLFYFFGGDGTDRAGLGGGYIPRRCTPAHSSAPGWTAHGRQQRRPCQMKGRPCKARHTRPDDGHTAPVCTRYQTGHAGQIVPAAVCWSAGSVSDRARPNGQKRNELFRLFFLFKSLDKMNGNVYTIDSERKRSYTTTKQEDKTMKNTNNILYLECRGCYFFANDSINNLSDVGTAVR